MKILVYVFGLTMIFSCIKENNNSLSKINNVVVKEDCDTVDSKFYRTSVDYSIDKSLSIESLRYACGKDITYNLSKEWKELPLTKIRYQGSYKDILRRLYRLDSSAILSIKFSIVSHENHHYQLLFMKKYSNYIDKYSKDVNYKYLLDRKPTFIKDSLIIRSDDIFHYLEAYYYDDNIKRYLFHSFVSMYNDNCYFNISSYSDSILIDKVRNTVFEVVNSLNYLKYLAPGSDCYKNDTLKFNYNKMRKRGEFIDSMSIVKSFYNG